MEGKYSTSGLHCVDYQTLERSYHDSRDAKIELIRLLSKYHCSDNIVLFNSGFWALVGALKIKLKRAKIKGVLMPSLTYRRLADAVYWAGGIPIFADVDPDTLALCPDNVSSILLSRNDVGVVLLVQPIVGSVSVLQMKSVCESSGVELVVDSVESVHDTIQGARTGSFPVSEVFSVHASKFINGFEGGYVAAGGHDEKVELENFRDITSSFSLGMTKYHAHIAACNLKAINKFVRHNKQIYEQYLSEFSQSDCLPILLKAFPLEEQCGFKNIVAISKAPRVNVQHLCKHLNVRGIGARQHYQPPLHSKKYSYEVKAAQALSVTENIGPRLLNLPCGWRFKAEDVQFVLRNVGEYSGAR